MVVHRCARCFGGVAVMHTSIDSDLDMIFGLVRRIGRFGIRLRRRLGLERRHGREKGGTEMFRS